MELPILRVVHAVPPPRQSSAGRKSTGMIKYKADSSAGDMPIYTYIYICVRSGIIYTDVGTIIIYYNIHKYFKTGLRHARASGRVK